MDNVPDRFRGIERFCEMNFSLRFPKVGDLESVIEKYKVRNIKKQYIYIN